MKTVQTSERNGLKLALKVEKQEEKLVVQVDITNTAQIAIPLSLSPHNRGVQLDVEFSKNIRNFLTYREHIHEKLRRQSRLFFNFCQKWTRKLYQKNRGMYALHPDETIKRKLVFDITHPIDEDILILAELHGSDLQLEYRLKADKLAGLRKFKEKTQLKVVEDVQIAVRTVETHDSFDVEIKMTNMANHPILLHASPNYEKGIRLKPNSAFKQSYIDRRFIAPPKGVIAKVKKGKYDAYTLQVHETIREEIRYEKTKELYEDAQWGFDVRIDSMEIENEENEVFSFQYDIHKETAKDR